MKRRAVCFDLKLSWQNIARMYNTLAAKYNLGISEAFVLLHLEEKGQQLNPVAAALGMEPGSLPRTLNKIEEKGWITRTKPSSGDKRVVSIALTADGLEAKEIAKDHVKAFNNRLAQQIPAEKLAVFFEVIDLINQTVNQPQPNIQYEAQHP